MDAVLPSIRPFAAALQRVDVPPEDRTLSPYTGLAREHWVAAAEDLLLAVAPYRSASGARIDLPGRPSRQGPALDGLEGFARTFLLAAFLSAGGASSDQARIPAYLEGLVAATRTAGAPSDAWQPVGSAGERWGQAQVEAASIALSLHIARASTWDLLDDGEQDAVEGWLRTVLGTEPAPNNWHLFALTVASLLEDVGRGDAATARAIDRGIELLDGWYRGEGWYSDGDGAAFDHYVGWALHLYPMLHARLTGDRALEERLGGRLREFLATFGLLFDRNGGPLHQGRSLTYRMATGAAVALGAVTGHTPLEPGASRRILSATLRHFLERGATTRGVLSLGWFGPYERIVQRYSGPGSPYWASKGFLALSLPESHEFWTATESALPADTESVVRPIRPVGWMVQATADDGLVRVHNHGSHHLRADEGDGGATDPLYARFAYSTRTGPTPGYSPSDNDVQVRYRGVWSVRRRFRPASSGPDWIASSHVPWFVRFSPHDGSTGTVLDSTLPGAVVQSAVVAHGAAEVRIHRLRGVPDGLEVRASGWALAAESPDELTADVRGAAVRLRQGDLTSTLRGAGGWDAAGWSPGTEGTAFGPWAAVPALSGTAGAGLFVAVASLSAADGAAEADGTVAEVEGSSVRITWADGASSAVDLDEVAW